MSWQCPSEAYLHIEYIKVSLFSTLEAETALICARQGTGAGGAKRCRQALGCASSGEIVVFSCLRLQKAGPSG